jgi:hypothetical protein
MFMVRNRHGNDKKCLKNVLKSDCKNPLRRSRRMWNKNVKHILNTLYLFLSISDVECS